jgi:hypothetical protein
MTHTTTVLDNSVVGDRREIVADVDITSLDNADSESFDPTSEFGDLDVCRGLSILQVENAGTYVVSTEQTNDIHVEEYGGTDPTSTTDVGVVRIKAVGAATP